MPLTLDNNNKPEFRAKREQKLSRRLFVFTSLMFLGLLLWQSISSSVLHKSYQQSLMKSVTENIRNDYQRYFNELRVEIDAFQQKYRQEISQLNTSADKANEEDYMKVLKPLLTSIKHTRLFAIIDENGDGVLKHITGNFLPSCEKEIALTISQQKQEHLFLHRSKSSVHFDLLQPLLTNNGKGHFFFVAFNPDVLQELLIKYQLPHQQLFIMRTDKVGKIELTTENTEQNYQKMMMSVDEIENFSYSTPIAGTKWQLAIRLDEKYNSEIFFQGIIKAIVIWLVLTFFIYAFYRIEKKRLKKQHVLKQALAYKDNYDSLTGLDNRASFHKHLVQSINANLEQQGVAFHIDIDQFQIINNTYGYAAGDKYLYQLSVSLKEFLPDNAIISRLTNDEFALLLPELNYDNAKSYAHEIRKFISQMHISQLPQDISITASVGAVVLDNKQLNSEQVLASLAQAVSLAKQKGRNRVQLYQSDDKLLTQHAQEMASIHDLALALENNHLVLYRQEIKTLQNQKEDNLHYEVLVRMNTAGGELKAPGYFIPAAEKYGLIKQLDRWVIAATFKAISENESDTNHYSINVSGLTLADRDIYDYVELMFKTHQVSPTRICFEITETYAITHLKSALHFISQMKALGCYFSLDDFGSGLSSFSYLQKLPVDIIKIDGSFVHDIHKNKVNRIFVENIQRTAVAMGKKTVAEFIESEEIANILIEIGVSYGQGYHLHKPEFWFELSQQK